MAKGQLTVFCGPMFAGKSTALLEQVSHAQAGGHRTSLLKPAFDVRGGVARVITHGGLSQQATPLVAMPALGSAEIPHGTGVVVLDEVQFMEAPRFKGNVIEGVRELLLNGVDVVAGGLDMDWQGHPFRITGLLCAMATTVAKLQARCAICGAPAPLTQKTGGDAGSAVELGAGNIYQACCGTHWRPSILTRFEKRGAAGRLSSEDGS